MATPLPTYKFETWMGALGSVSSNTTLPWRPYSTCSYITEAVTTIYQDVSMVTGTFQTALTTSQYRMNLTEWLTTNCLPTNWVTGTANYYYPGACPDEWTSWPTITTITSIADGSESKLTLTDAACCPAGYTSQWQGENIFCISTLARPTNYPFQKWSLWSTSGATTSYSEVSKNGVPQSHAVPFVNGMNLTYVPIFVRTGAAGKEFVPTKTATIEDLTFTGVDGVVETGGVGDIIRDKPARGVNLALVLGISLPLGIILIAIVAYILWCCSGRKRQEREASKHEREQNLSERDAALARSDDTTEEMKPELVGSRPECDITSPVVPRSELSGEEKGNNGVISSLGELRFDERTVDEDPAQARRVELDDQARRRGVAEVELDDQTRRAELDGTNSAKSVKVPKDANDV